MNELIESAREVIRKRCANLDGQLNVELVRFILELQTSLNVYGIFGVPDIANQLWTKIASVPNGEAITALIDGASEFRIRNQLGALKWRELLALLRDCTGLTEQHDIKEGPSGIYERIPKPEVRLTLLANHDWLVFLILLTMAEPVMTPAEIKAHTPAPTKE
jgi:hypothetical protein